MTERHGLTALCHQPLFQLAPVGAGIHAAGERGAHIRDRKPPFVLLPNAADRLLLEQDDTALIGTELSGACVGLRVRASVVASDR